MTIEYVENSFEISLVDSSFGGLAFEGFSLLFGFLGQVEDGTDAVFFKNTFDELLLFWH